MKLCFITRNYPDSIDEPVVSGEIKNPFYLSQTLEDRGHDVTVVTHGEDGVSTVGGVTVYRVPPGRFMGFVASLSEGYQTARRSGRLLREHDFDLVHAHYPNLAIAARRAHGNMTVPLITTAHGTFVPEMRANVPPLTPYGLLARANGVVQKRIERYTWTWSDGAVTAGAFQLAEMTDVYDLPPDHVTSISNGVDTNRYCPDEDRRVRTRDTLSLDDEPTVLFVGRLARKKGLQYLLEALVEVRDSLPATRLIVVGGTDDFDHYGDVVRERVRALGLENVVHFESGVPETDLPGYYNAADVVVVPSINYEPLPTVVFETLASGTPIVGTNDWGIPEQVGSTETLVPEKAPSAIANQVRKILEDDAYAAQLGERNRQRALELDWDIVAEEHESLYQETLN